MAPERQRRFSIVIRFKDQRISGRWQDTIGDIWHEITVNGETDIRWGNKVWDAIFSNLQLDTERDFCRILVYSGQLMEDGMIPSIQNSWDWTLEDISQALSDAQNNSISRWYINGIDLDGRYTKLFPAYDGRAGGNCYIYTVPVYQIQKHSDKCTPLVDVINDNTKLRSNRLLSDPGGDFRATDGLDKGTPLVDIVNENTRRRSNKSSNDLADGFHETEEFDKGTPLPVIIHEQNQRQSNHHYANGV